MSQMPRYGRAFRQFDLASCSWVNYWHESRFFNVLTFFYCCHVLRFFYIFNVLTIIWTFLHLWRDLRRQYVECIRTYNKMQLRNKSQIPLRYLVRSWFEAGRKHVRSWSATSFEPDSVMEFGFEPVCDQLRTSIEPASVIQFSFNIT